MCSMNSSTVIGSSWRLRWSTVDNSDARATSSPKGTLPHLGNLCTANRAERDQDRCSNVIHENKRKLIAGAALWRDYTVPFAALRSHKRHACPGGSNRRLSR